MSFRTAEWDSMPLEVWQQLISIVYECLLQMKMS